MWLVQTRNDTGGNVFDVVGVLRVFDVGVVELRVDVDAEGVFDIVVG